MSALSIKEKQNTKLNTVEDISLTLKSYQYLYFLISVKVLLPKPFIYSISPKVSSHLRSHTNELKSHLILYPQGLI